MHKCAAVLEQQKNIAHSEVQECVLECAQQAELPFACVTLSTIFVYKHVMILDDIKVSVAALSHDTS